MGQGRFRWWQGALILVAANIVSALPAGIGGDGAFYNSFRQPAAAPPDWVFTPVWLALNVTSVIALHRIANLPPHPRKRVFIASECLGWVLFAAFTTLYFLLRSPVLGAIDTVLGAMAAATSCLMAARIDRLAAVLVGLRAAWLLYAGYVSVWVALANPDPFLGG